MVDTSVLDQLEQSIAQLDQRLRDAATQPIPRGCFDVLDNPLEPSPFASLGISPVGYIRNPAGTVSLSGLITGTKPGCAFTLPTGYRPTASTSYALPYGAVATVQTNGCVNITKLPDQLYSPVRQEFTPNAGDPTVRLASTPLRVLLVTRNGYVQSEFDNDYTPFADIIAFSVAFGACEHVVVDYALPYSGLTQPYYEEFDPQPGSSSVLLSHSSLAIQSVTRNGYEQATQRRCVPYFYTLEPDSDYSVFDDVLIFSTPFSYGETVTVAYSGAPTWVGEPDHQEFSPAPGETVLHLAGTPAQFIAVARNGQVQSQFIPRQGYFAPYFYYGSEFDYTVKGSTLTFSDPFLPGERVVVAMITSTVPGIDLNGVSFQTAR